VVRKIGGNSMNEILIIGSGHSALEYENYKNKNFIIVTVNNSWKITNDWDYWVSAGDYKGDTPPIIKENQKIITGKEYNLAMSKYGHVNNCGFSIMLNTSYWVLENLKPNKIYYLGADMDYTPNKNGDTHFYGVGQDIQKYKKSDPDIMVELNSKGDKNYLYNIYMRFYNIAKNKEIEVFNLSKNKNTRLPYPKINIL
jgi:hypothetical protein